MPFAARAAAGARPVPVLSATQHIVYIVAIAKDHLLAAIDADTAAAASPSIGVSPVRFYCLAVATAIAGFQGAYWNDFGPIAPALKPFYGWDDATIALLSNWGPISYFVAVVPSAWLLDVRGLRD